MHSLSIVHPYQVIPLIPPLFPAENGPPVQAIGRLQQGAGWVAKPGIMEDPGGEVGVEKWI